MISGVILVAEVGLFIALHQIIVALRRSQAPSCALLAWGTALVKNATPWRFLLRYPLPPPPLCGYRRS